MFDQMKQMKQLMSMLGNADKIKQQMEAMQAALGEMRVDAESGAGAVRVTVNGRFEVVSLRLDPAMLGALSVDAADDDRALVEDLIAGAVNEAMRRVQDLVQQEMMGMAPGLNLPEM